MKKNLLLTFFLLCLLPLAVFAEVTPPELDTVKVVKPQNSVVKVTFTSAVSLAQKDTFLTQSGTYNGSLLVVHGTQLIVEVIPNEFYDFEKIMVGETAVTDNPHTITSVESDITISSSVVRMRSLTITKPVNCTVKVSYIPSPSVSADVLEEEYTSSSAEDVVLKVKDSTPVIITVLPNPGYAFEDLSIGGTKTTTNPSTITSLTSDRIIEASVVKVHSVKISKPANSTVVVHFTAPLGSTAKDTTFTASTPYHDELEVKDGTELTVKVEPNLGYEFSKTIMGTTESTANPTVVSSLTTDLEISTEVVKKKYTLTITPPTNGTITVMAGSTQLTSGALVEHGTQLTVTATPEAEHELTSLTVNSEDLTSGSTYTVSGPVTVQAVFTYVAPKYAITFAQPENGTLTVRRRVVDGSNEAYVLVSSGSLIAKGTVLYIYADPADTYVVSSFKINNTSVDDITAFPVLKEVEGATSIAVTFTKGKQLITITPPVNGEITVKDNDRFINSGSSVDRGTVLTLNAYAKPNYKFKKWWDGNTDAERQLTVDVLDITVSAEFALITGIEELYTGMSVYAADGAIYLNGVTEDVTSVSIIDMAGKIVYNSKPEFGQTVLSPVNRGVYVVLVKGTKGNVSTKVIVK